MAFGHIENKHTLYRVEDCMKKFCITLKGLATNILDFQKEKMLPLTKEELKLHQDATKCYICRKRILQSSLKLKIVGKLKFIIIIHSNIEAQDIASVI